MTDGEATAEPTWARLAAPPRVGVSTELTAAAVAGTSPTRLLRDWLPLWRGPGRLTLHEYLYYRLWDRACGHDDRCRFIGKQAQVAMHNACLGAGWNDVARDKVLFDAVARDRGLPVPELIAVIGRDRSSRTGIPHLATAAEVAAWLRGPAPYPIFLKPAAGKYSLGAIAADGHDAMTDTLNAAGMPPAPVGEVAERLAQDPGGYVAQRRLRPHPRLAGADGTTGSVRLLVLVGPAGPALERATLKVPAPGNPADNYWRPGNAMAALDPANGKAVRWVSGAGSTMAIDGPTPAGTAERAGLGVPGWDALVALALRAAGLMHGLGTQSWDVAPTDCGPVLLEVNRGGDLNLGQLASGQGALTPEFRAHLATHGYPGME